MPRDLLPAVQSTSRRPSRNIVQVEATLSNDLEEFFKVVDGLYAKIAQINELTKEFHRKQSNLMVDSASEQNSQQIEEINFTIKTNSSTVHSKIKIIDSDAKRIPVESVLHRIYRTQHTMLFNQFNGAISVYNASQLEWRSKHRGRIIKEFTFDGQTMSEDQLDDYLDQGQASVFTRNLKKESEMAIANLRMIEARHEEILKLEKSLKDLMELFTDLAMLVESQGEMINRIEFNVQQTVVHVKQGAQYIEQAVDYNKSANKKRCCLITVAVVILLIIALIITLAIVLK